MVDVLAQNTHRDSEAAKVSKLCFAASSSLCNMLPHSAIFNGCFELEAFSDNIPERPHNGLKVKYSPLKRNRKRVVCAGMDLDQHSAWNFGQCLSPKAKPWDGGSPDQGKRQTPRNTEGFIGFTETGCHVDSKQRFSHILFIL